MLTLLEKFNAIVWGAPALLLIISVGLYLTVRSGFVQITMFPRALSMFIQQFRNKNNSNKEVSGYQALCTALAATVGTGNLAGVAGAISIGGPGAIFWIWVCGILGMVIKFAEATLAIRYRVRNKSGEYVGGPMYMISRGIGEKCRCLAVLYSFFGLVASFGVGNSTQINTVVSCVRSTLQVFNTHLSNVSTMLLGLLFAVVITLCLSGGAKRIGRAAEVLVPIAACGYIVLSLIVLIVRAQYIPEAFSVIISGAFSPRSVTGGMIGSAFIALRVGTSRGVFTNEAGMGTASIAHAAANVTHPVEQGFMGMMEVFIDTIVICTLTALVILCSGIPIFYGADVGIELTTKAFSTVYGKWILIAISAAVSCFAFATVLGWGLYGARCAQYLFGESAWRWFVIAQAIIAVIGAIMQTQTVWLLAEIVNGLMAIPNLIALIILSPELLRLIIEYKRA